MNHQNSTTSQRNRVLKRLEMGQCSTFELRHKDDIPCVAARVYELRHNFGYNIQTQWVEDKNPGGGRHRVANYVLMPGKWQGGAQ